ncbi:hypothetical protein MP638_005823 [Amoeboaphelidium occidentale]|nr:hypothetical protein MP638_005823 [Amoeboaphelidium occidentale]
MTAQKRNDPKIRIIAPMQEYNWLNSVKSEKTGAIFETGTQSISVTKTKKYTQELLEDLQLQNEIIKSDQKGLYAFDGATTRKKVVSLFGVTSDDNSLVSLSDAFYIARKEVSFQLKNILSKVKWDKQGEDHDNLPVREFFLKRYQNDERTDRIIRNTVGLFIRGIYGSSYERWTMKSFLPPPPPPPQKKQKQKNNGQAHKNIKSLGKIVFRNGNATLRQRLLESLLQNPQFEFIDARAVGISDDAVEIVSCDQHESLLIEYDHLVSTIPDATFRNILKLKEHNAAAQNIFTKYPAIQVNSLTVVNFAIRKKQEKEEKRSNLNSFLCTDGPALGVLFENTTSDKSIRQPSNVYTVTVILSPETTQSLIKDTNVDEDEARRIALDVLIKQAQCLRRDDTDLIVDSLVTLNRECMPEYTPQHNNYTTALKESLQPFRIFPHGFNYRNKRLGPGDISQSDVKEYVYDENVTTTTTSAAAAAAAAAEMNRDNEYFINATSTAGNTPKIVITSSRDPSSRLVQFLKEMKLTLPESQRINRGSYTMNDLQDLCHRNEVTDLLIINEHRGQPDSLILSHFPHGPTAYFSLHNVVLRHDLNNSSYSGEDKLEKVSECIPHLVLNGFQSQVGLRVKQILQHIFPPLTTTTTTTTTTSKDSKRVCTFSVLNDYISFRNHLYLLPGGNNNNNNNNNKKECVLNEIGPRFEMKIYKIKLGLLTQEAEDEFVLRPFMRTSRKKDNL